MILNENGSYTPTGGTSITFVRTGKQVTNGTAYANTAETDFFAREEIQLSHRESTLQSDGSYSKMKETCVILRPRKDTSGKVYYNIVRIELEVDPVAGPTESDNLRSLALSALSDTELLDFWRSGGQP